MRKLLTNVRFWILTIVVITVATIAFANGITTEAPFYNDMIRTYALLAATMLYLTLLITPVITLFPQVLYKAELIKARRATGVSVVIFACFHSYFAFFKQLGGFRGLLYLDQHYLVAISVATIANTIFVLMALTAFDYMVRKLGPYWKKLHKYIYFASFLILYHALSIGSQFVDLHTPAARSMLLAVFVLLLLQALRMDRRWQPQGSRIGIFTVVILTVASFTLATFAGTTEAPGTSHAGHTTGTAVTTPINTTPLLRNDITRRYNANVVTDPLNPLPGQTVTMTIHIFDANTGVKIDRFTQLYGQFMHIVIVDNGLQNFAHLHPTTTAGGGLVATYVFPTSDRYHVYLNFAPYQAPEQEIGVSLQVGDAVPSTVSPGLVADTVTAKQLGDYKVTMIGTNSLDSANLSAGNEPITFSVFKGSAPALLAPYIGAFGHLTLVNTQTYDFIHAHPGVATAPLPTDRSGPTVTFLPLALYGPIKSGTYRVFAEFAPDSTYLLAPFTLTVK